MLKMVIGGITAAVWLASPGPAIAAAHQEPEAVVRAFTAAQGDFDQAKLRALTTDDYVEISPVGEVDPREKMLGFYAPEHRQAGPTITLTEPLLKRAGDTAILVMRLGFAAPGPSTSPPRAMRGSFVLRRQQGAWKIAFAQYTGIRP